MQPRHTLVVAGTLAMVASVPGLAFAAATWNASGAGVAAASALTLSTPGPSNTCTQSGNSSAIAVSWTAVTGATTYRVEHRKDSGSYVTVQSSSAVTYNVTESSGGTHSYRVTALLATNWGSQPGTTTRETASKGTCLVGT